MLMDEKPCPDCNANLIDPCTRCPESPYDLPLNCAGCEFQYNSPYTIPEYKIKIQFCLGCEKRIYE
jgi:hypothetical protein